MEFFAGIDLGKRKSQIKILDANRKVVEELKIDNDPKVPKSTNRRLETIHRSGAEGGLSIEGDPGDQCVRGR